MAEFTVHHGAPFVYGRTMYELMVSSFPTAAADPTTPAPIVEFAHLWFDKPKLVFSSTLREVAWNATLAQGDVGDELLAWKARFDGDLWVGGPRLASELVRCNRIDEYRIILAPSCSGRVRATSRQSSSGRVCAASKPARLRTKQSSYGTNAAPPALVGLEHKCAELHRINAPAIIVVPGTLKLPQRLP